MKFQPSDDPWVAVPEGVEAGPPVAVIGPVPMGLADDRDGRPGLPARDLDEVVDTVSPWSVVSVLLTPVLKGLSKVDVSLAEKSVNTQAHYHSF